MLSWQQICICLKFGKQKVFFHQLPCRKSGNIFFRLCLWNFHWKNRQVANNLPSALSPKRPSFLSRLCVLWTLWNTNVLHVDFSCTLFANVTKCVEKNSLQLKMKTKLNVPWFTEKCVFSLCPYSENYEKKKNNNKRIQSHVTHTRTAQFLRPHPLSRQSGVEFSVVVADPEWSAESLGANGRS